MPTGSRSGASSSLPFVRLAFAPPSLNVVLLPGVSVKPHAPSLYTVIVDAAPPYMSAPVSAKDASSVPPLPSLSVASSSALAPATFSTAGVPSG